MKGVLRPCCFRAAFLIGTVLAGWATATAENWTQWKFDCRHSGNAPDREVTTPLGLLAVAPLSDAIFTAPVVADGRVYAVGGWDGETVTDTLFIYDPETDQWEEGRRLPEKRAFSGAVAIQGNIYVIGGHDGQEQRAEMWSYEPSTDTWVSAPQLPQPRAGLAAASEGNSIYVFGGGEDGQSHLPERFDLLTQAWSTFDTPLTGTWRHAVTAAIGPNIYVVGGWGGDYLAINEVYKALPYETFLPSVGIDSSD